MLKSKLSIFFIRIKAKFYKVVKNKSIIILSTYGSKIKRPFRSFIEFLIYTNFIFLMPIYYAFDTLHTLTTATTATFKSKRAT